MSDEISWLAIAISVVTLLINVAIVWKTSIKNRDDALVFLRDFNHRDWPPGPCSNNNPNCLRFHDEVQTLRDKRKYLPKDLLPDLDIFLEAVGCRKITREERSNLLVLQHSLNKRAREKISKKNKSSEEKSLENAELENE